MTHLTLSYLEQLPPRRPQSKTIWYVLIEYVCMCWGGLPGSSASIESACNAGDPSLIPSSGGSTRVCVCVCVCVCVSHSVVSDCL